MQRRRPRLPSVPYAAVVLDTELLPVSDVLVRLAGTSHGAQPEEASTISADGRFQLEIPLGQAGHLIVRDERYVTLMYSAVSPDLEGDWQHTLIVARRRGLEGRVVDEEGRGLAGVRLTHKTPHDLRHRFDAAILDRSILQSFALETDDLGGFQFDGLPALRGAQIEARSVGYADLVRDVPAEDAEPLTLVLRSTQGSVQYVSGRVLDRTGAPVAGAWVSLGRQSQRTDPSGAFQLAAGDMAADDMDGEELRVVALSAGYLPASLICTRADLGAQRTIELVLDAPALAISGHILDSRCKPLAGAKVSAMDPTPFAYVPHEGSAFAFAPAYVESMLRGDWTNETVTTGADGSFVLGGLLDKRYRLRFYDRNTLTVSRSEWIDAGRSAVTLAFEEEFELGPIAGRVLSEHGVPLAGIRVLPWRRAQPEREPDAEDYTDRFYGSETRTDGEGRFRFKSLARRGTSLGVWGGPTIAYSSHPLVEQVDVENMEILISVQCHFVVRLAGGAQRADTFRILGANGDPIDLIKREGEITFSMSIGRLIAGRSEMLLAPEGANTLVLYRDGVEESRVPILLLPGSVNRIDL